MTFIFKKRVLPTGVWIISKFTEIILTKFNAKQCVHYFVLRSKMYIIFINNLFIEHTLIQCSQSMGNVGF